MPIVLRTFFVELLHSLSQSINDCGFTCSCETNHHDSVTHVDGLHQLNDFCEEFLGFLVIGKLQLVLDGSLK